MNVFYLSTALATIAAIGSPSLALAQEPAIISQADYRNIYNAVNLSHVSDGLHTGDFQVVARAIEKRHLYDGGGSSLMKTSRLFRY